MKKLFLIFIAATLCGCNEKAEFERNSKTLAGSIASIYEYKIGGEFDGESLGDDNIIFFYQHGNNKIDFSLVNSRDGGFVFNDVKSINTSAFKLTGEPANVSFDESVKLTLNKESLPDTTIDGTVSGWLKNIFLIELWTKFSPANYKYEGIIEIAFSDPDTGTQHKLVINQIL